MPYQLELNKVASYTTYSNYYIKPLLHNNSMEASMLEWCGIVTRDLSCLSVRPVVKHNNSGIQVDLEGALHSSDARSFYYDVGVVTSDVKTNVKSKCTVGVR
jgi:hypothetical protein